MEGKARNADVFNRSEGGWENLTSFIQDTLLRLERLTFKKVLIHLAEFIYKEATLLVVLKMLDKPPVIQVPVIPVEARLLDINNIDEISSLNNLARDRIALFFADGSKCLGVFHHEELIGYSWCHYRNHKFPFFAYSLEVSNGVYIGPDFVLPEYRGNRIHGFALTNIFAMLFKEGHRNVWSAVLSNNYASIKGLFTVGFILQKQIKVIRIFKSIVRKSIRDFS